MIHVRLGNIVTINDKKKIKRVLQEIEIKKNLSKRKKKEIYDHLVELVNTLNKKETYQYHDRDYLDSYGIRDIENLFSNVDDYYKPILVESSFKNNYKYYESRGDKDKKLSVRQYQQGNTDRRTDDGFNCPIRSLFRLFRGITANNNGDFYCLDWLHSFRTDNALKRHKRLCSNNDYCLVKMPTKDNKTLKYNHGQKSLKAPFTICADLECSLIKEQSCQNNPKESYTERKAKHEPSGYSLSLISSFGSKENKHNVYRGRDCIKRFCSDRKELGTEIINFEEKEMIPLTIMKISFMRSKKNVT